MKNQLSLFQPTKTRESLANDIWRACDILRRDNNYGGIMEYVEHLAWLLFLRFLGAREEEAAEAQLSGASYQRILDGDLRWSGWKGPSGAGVSGGIVAEHFTIFVFQSKVVSISWIKKGRLGAVKLRSEAGIR